MPKYSSTISREIILSVRCAYTHNKLYSLSRFSILSCEYHELRQFVIAKMSSYNNCQNKHYHLLKEQQWWNLLIHLHSSVIPLSSRKDFRLQFIKIYSSMSNLKWEKCFFLLKNVQKLSNNFINEMFENIVVRLNIEEKKFMNSDRKWASKHDDDEKKNQKWRCTKNLCWVDNAQSSKFI